MIDMAEDETSSPAELEAQVDRARQRLDATVDELL
ncbi:MAG: DUF3618 domain-containing protein, partial [Hyphomicrobiales bacterium]|nr:DUF3618 domain-containing protein [Hyphomicrobiales bacterium]